MERERETGLDGTRTHLSKLYVSPNTPTLLDRACKGSTITDRMCLAIVASSNPDKGSAPFCVSRAK